MYAVFPYAVATGIVELPYLLVQSCIFVPISYFMIGFRLAVEPIFLFIIIFMQSITLYTFMGQFFTYLTPNAPFATMLGGLCHLIWNIFNGFLVPFPQMAVGWRWLNWASATTYVIYGLATSQLGQSTRPVVVPGLYQLPRPHTCDGVRVACVAHSVAVPVMAQHGAQVAAPFVNVSQYSPFVAIIDRPGFALRCPRTAALELGHYPTLMCSVTLCSVSLIIAPDDCLCQKVAVQRIDFPESTVFSGCIIWGSLCLLTSTPGVRS
jgi:hypothetical protein